MARYCNWNANRVLTLHLQAVWTTAATEEQSALTNDRFVSVLGQACILALLNDMSVMWA